MPSQQEVQWSRLKIGGIALGVVAILTILVFVMTSSSGVGFLSHRLTVISYFDDALGLKPGAAVTLEGITIGTVKTVTLVATPEHKAAPVQVVMRLDNKYQSDLHTDSTVSLATAGVLGDTGLDISSQFAVGPPLRDGDEMKTLEAPSLFGVEKTSQAAVSSMKSTLGKMDSVVDMIQTGQGTLGKFINDPQLINEANATVSDIQKITSRLNSTDNSAGKFLNPPAKGSPTSVTLDKFSSIAQDLQDGKGSLGKMLHDPAFQATTKSTWDNASSLMDDVNAGKGGIGVLAKDPAVSKNLSASLTQGKALITNVNAGQGSVGKILKTDGETQTDLKALQTESNSLVTMIEKDPKKFFTIEFRIFETRKRHRISRPHLRTKGLY
jgi:phospholipid/cholesterol/gamma-HCH transport system substrate-binding protein